VARARRGEGPSILENRPYRYRGHFEGDPQKYRSDDEIQSEAEANDPIARFRKKLLSEKVLSDETESRLRREIADRIEAAVRFGLDAPEPRPEEAFEDLYVNP
jgi:pyruvate dehydrogenase E1 component alpha subunit